MIERRFGPILRVAVAVDAGARFSGPIPGGLYRIATGTDGGKGGIKQGGFGDLAVVAGRVIGRMARTAFHDGHVFIIFNFPTLGVTVAFDARARIMVAGSS